MKFYDRYVLGELLGLFVASFGFFLVVFISIDSLAGPTRAVMELGFWPWLKYLSYRALGFQNVVTPVAILLASLLCHTRMATQGDLLGLKVSGLSMQRISRPAFLFFLLITAGGFLVGEFLAPPAERAAWTIVLEAGRRENTPLKGITGRVQVLPDGRERMMIAHSLDLERGELNGLFLNYFFEGLRTEELYASGATWDGTFWRLDKVRHLRFNGHQERAEETTFATLTSALPLIGDLPAPDELLQSDSGSASLRQLRQRLSYIPDEAAYADQRAKLAWEFHRRLALATSGLLFGLLSLPFAFSSQQRGFGASMGITVVLALCYYLASSLAGAEWIVGLLGPVLAAWLANLAFGLVAVVLLIRCFRGQALP